MKGMSDYKCTFLYAKHADDVWVWVAGIDQTVGLVCWSVHVGSEGWGGCKYGELGGANIIVVNSVDNLQ